MMNCLCGVALVDTLLNHCTGGCIVAREACPAKRAVVVDTPLACGKNATLAQPLHAADIHQ